jgi:hypothetical protein
MHQRKTLLLKHFFVKTVIFIAYLAWLLNLERRGSGVAAQLFGVGGVGVWSDTWRNSGTCETFSNYSNLRLKRSF